jgi:hypothetical protein
MIFFMYKDTVLKMFVLFYTVEIVYICIFITCSISYCLNDTRMDPWNVFMYMSTMRECMLSPLSADRHLSFDHCPSIISRVGS